MIDRRPPIRPTPFFGMAAMRPLSFVKDNPVTVLGVALLALTTWVAVDLANALAPRKQAAESRASANELPLPAQPSAVAVADGVEPASFPARPPVSTVVLPNVKPGMTRYEVEGFLGTPTPDQIQPVTRANGRVTYSTAYELDDIGPPMTIRPIQPRPRSQPQARPDRLMIAFVFDANQPGHPLIDILFPDPLF
jgi:hypothetical protein